MKCNGPQMTQMINERKAQTEATVRDFTHLVCLGGKTSQF